jgi:hypothetical protein
MCRAVHMLECVHAQLDLRKSELLFSFFPSFFFFDSVIFQKGSHNFAQGWPQIAVVPLPPVQPGL